MPKGLSASIRIIIGLIFIIGIASLVIAITDTFTSSPNVAIPDATGGVFECSIENVAGSVSDNVAVAIDGAITDVAVQINISHSYIGDLIVDLQSPAGTSVRLLDKIGETDPNLCACSSSNINATLSTSGAIPIENSCGSQASGSIFLPHTALTAFNGEDATGTWTLTVQDDDRASTGTLNSWSLIITTDAEEVVPILDPETTPETEPIVDLTPEPPPQFQDGRINRWDAAAPVVIYLADVDGETGLNIYRVTENSAGVFVLQVTPADIAAIPDMPAQDTLIKAGDGVQVWRLSSGDFRMIATGENGKTYVMTFGSLGVDIPYTSYEQ